MVSFILLLNWTEQGVKNFKKTTRRAADFKAIAEKAGAKVKEVYWTMGPYDIVAIVEAPDDEAVTSLVLKTASLGNVRTQTLRAYSAEQMNRIISKV